MKMGKAKPSKKLSKQVRKENRLQYGNRRNTSKLASSHHQKTLNCHSMDSSDDEGEHQTSGSDSVPSLSRPSQNNSNSSINGLVCEELGVAPLPAEDKPSRKRRSLPTASTSAEGLDNMFAPPGVTIRSSVSGAKCCVVAQGPPPKAANSAPTSLSPRVLGDSQRENLSPNRRESVTGICGFLTPPRRFDLKFSPTVPTGSGYFDRVPDEVILHIFYFLRRSNLARCMAVCRKWYRIGSDELLWRRVELGDNKVEAKTFGCLIVRGTTHLRLAGAKIFGDQMPNLSRGISLEPRMSRLQFLDLTMASISKSLLKDVLSHCRQLRKVSLEFVHVSSVILHHLSENTQLDTLNLSMSKGVTVWGLRPLFARCTQLTELSLAWTDMSSACVSYVCDAVPESIERLDISGCRDNISDRDVVRLCERCKSLVELDLSDAGQLTWHTTEAIRQNLHQLVMLSLNRCYSISSENFCDLGDLPCLQMLNVFGIKGIPFIQHLQLNLPRIIINRELLSTIARPTTGLRRTSIWEHRMREDFMF